MTDRQRTSLEKTLDYSVESVVHVLRRIAEDESEPTEDRIRACSLVLGYDSQIEFNEGELVDLDVEEDESGER